MRFHQSAEVIGDAAALVARPVKELTEHLARLVERARVSLVMINSGNNIVHAPNALMTGSAAYITSHLTNNSRQIRGNL